MNHKGYITFSSRSYIRYVHNSPFSVATNHLRKTIYHNLGSPCSILDTCAISIPLAPVWQFINWTILLARCANSLPMDTTEDPELILLFCFESISLPANPENRYGLDLALSWPLVWWEYSAWDRLGVLNRESIVASKSKSWGFRCGELDCSLSLLNFRFMDSVFSRSCESWSSHSCGKILMDYELSRVDKAKWCRSISTHLSCQQEISFNFCQHLL